MNMSNLRSLVREELNQLFTEYKWRGSFPHYRKAEKPGFIEVSDVYSKKYAYLNEKVKIFYMDFLESMSEDGYAIVPLAGICFPKNMKDKKRLRDMDGIQCCFLDGGRRNAQMITDLSITDRMGRKEIEEKLELLRSVIQ